MQPNMLSKQALHLQQLLQVPIQYDAGMPPNATLVGPWKGCLDRSHGTWIAVRAAWILPALLCLQAHEAEVVLAGGADHVLTVLGMLDEDPTFRTTAQ